MIATGADPLAPGRLLAERYRIGPMLGSGGTAAVHRATDELLGRTVAVKALVRPVGDDAAERRERAEIELLASLHHRSLVTLFDAGKALIDGLPVSFLVMELVEGPSLAQRLDEGPLPPAEVERLGRDLAEALAVVHAHGIVHRDVKPANVLLSPAPLHRGAFDAKLADFGIAALVGGERLTATGTVLGTAAYLSPEQATGTRVEAASDIYSLGLVLLEALTGRREYPGSLVESLSARLARDPEIPGELGYRWKSLLTAMTTRDPAQRPTAAAVLERLSEPEVSADATAATSAPAAATVGAVGAIAAGATAASSTAAADATQRLSAEPAATTARTSVALPRPRRRKRGLVLAAGLVAAGALVAIPVLSQQPTSTAKSPVGIELADLPGLVPDPGLAEPAITEPEPEQVAEPAPAPEPVAEPEPAVVVTPVDDGPGDGNGNGGNGNRGNGNGNGNGNSGSGGNGNGNGSNGNGNGSNGNGNGGNGNGNNGNGNRP